MMKMRWKSIKTLLSASAAVVLAGGALAPMAAQAQQCAEEEGGASKTLNTRVAQALQTIFEQMTAEQYQAALAGLNQLIAQRGASMADFDKATTYELRGSVKASLEDYAGALRDFQTALDTGALPQNRNNQLRYFIAQLNFQEQRYSQAISGLNQWINFARSCGEPVDASAYYLLAAAYTQITPPNWNAAISPGRNAIANSEEPKKTHYDLLNLIYSETNRAQDREKLLENMVNFWPGEKSYWVQLSGSYNNNGRDQEAFAVMEVAYRAGLLDKEAELLNLIQYYSFFDNPYRGASMLEREMNAGNIKRTQKNLVLLSQLWSQAREHKKSIPILREAAGRSDDGELYYRLGQVLLADEQYAAAQRALQSGLNRGGLDSKDAGDAWLLLGTARFNQAGPEDTAIWASAREAFVNAQRYSSSRARAASWIGYIDAVRTTYEAQKRLEEQQKRERCEADLQRIEQNRRIRELQNRGATADEEQFEASVIAACGDGSEEEPAAEEAPAEDTPADDAAAEDSDEAEAAAE